MAFTIGVVEITAAANLRASVTFNYFECVYDSDDDILGNHSGIGAYRGYD